MVSLILLNSFTSGGAERVVSRLFQDERFRPPQVFLAVLTPERVYDLPDGVEPLVIGPGLIRSALRLRRIIRQQAVEVVQSHLFRSHIVAAVASGLVGFRVHRPKLQMVMTVAVSAKYPKNTFRGFVARRVLRVLTRRAACIVFKSYGMAQDYEAAVGAPRRSVVIENPVRMAVSQGSGARRDLEAQRIVCVGRFHPQKRQADLVHAFSRIAQDVPRAELVFAGSGECLDPVKTLADTLGVGDRCHFHGQVTDIQELLRSSTVCVLPSEAEGFPNALLEAMSAGVPVISSDCPSGPREILTGTPTSPAAIPSGAYWSGACGVLYSVGDVEALSNALRDLLSNRDLQKKLSAAGEQRARYYSTLRAEDRYYDLLRHGCPST
ncbi:MAG: glycosyltransferase [Spirochaetaceae bacterium]